MIAGGASCGSVLRYLCKVGAKTRAGRDFPYTTLRSMLHNEQYNGMYIYGKRGPVDKQIRIPGGMPRIVDAETFAVVQAALVDRFAYVCSGYASGLGYSPLVYQRAFC